MTMNVISMTHERTNERMNQTCILNRLHAAYKLTWSPRWRHSHEKHGEILIDDEILETFIIDGDTEVLSNVAKEHDKPILVVDIIKKWSDNYRKEGLLLTNYSTPKKKACCQNKINDLIGKLMFTLLYIGDWDWYGTGKERRIDGC
jgi:hypothetical protein